MGFRFAVQVLLDLIFTVQMVELAAIALGVRQCIIADYHARRFHQPGFNRIVQAEI